MCLVVCRSARSLQDSFGRLPHGRKDALEATLVAERGSQPTIKLRVPAKLLMQEQKRCGDRRDLCGKESFTQASSEGATSERPLQHAECETR